jgi:hypothetical protein
LDREGGRKAAIAATGYLLLLEFSEFVHFVRGLLVGVDPAISHVSNGNHNGRTRTESRLPSYYFKIATALCDLSPIADHLAPNLLDVFRFSSRADGWVRSIARSELTRTRCGEASFSVVRISGSASGENGGLELGKALR